MLTRLINRTDAFDRVLIALLFAALVVGQAGGLVP